jgi:hypothetical protein
MFRYAQHDNAGVFVFLSSFSPAGGELEMPSGKLLMLAAKAQTSLAFARLRVTFRPWRGITFCNESPIAHFTAYNGNIKETPAPLKITA